MHVSNTMLRSLECSAEMPDLQCLMMGRTVDETAVMAALIRIAVGCDNGSYFAIDCNSDE